MNVAPLSPVLGANIDGVDLAAITDAGFEWHSDMTYEKTPPPASVLLGIEVPDEGGDTRFACQQVLAREAQRRSMVASMVAVSR